MTKAIRLEMMAERTIAECQEALNHEDNNLVRAFYYMRYEPIAKKRFSETKSDAAIEKWIAYQIKHAIIGQPMEDFDAID